MTLGPSFSNNLFMDSQEELPESEEQTISESNLGITTISIGGATACCCATGFLFFSAALEFSSLLRWSVLACNRKHRDER